MATATKRRRGGRFGLALCAAFVALVMGAAARADDVSNSLDGSIDAVAEAMPLTVGGADGTTNLYVTPRNSDGKNGCNLTGSTSLVLSISSSDTSIATVSPSSITFASCGDTPTLTVTPHNQGTASISASQTFNNTGATFNLAPVTFTVNVAPPPNTPPQIAVSGVTGGASYAKGSVPSATCLVRQRWCRDRAGIGRGQPARVEHELAAVVAAPGDHRSRRAVAARLAAAVEECDPCPRRPVG